MFQPQPTPFASSFHAPSSHSLSHSQFHGHSNNAHSTHSQSQQHQRQQHHSQNVGAYGMGVGAGGVGGGMDEYSFSPTPLGVQVMGANCMAMGHPHNLEMNMNQISGMRVVGEGGGREGGMRMAMGMGMGGGVGMRTENGMGQRVQSRSQSQSLGGEAAGAATPAPAPAPAAATAASAAAAPATHGPPSGPGPRRPGSATEPSHPAAATSTAGAPAGLSTGNGLYLLNSSHSPAAAHFHGHVSGGHNPGASSANTTSTTHPLHHRHLQHHQHQLQLQHQQLQLQHPDPGASCSPATSPTFYTSHSNNNNNNTTTTTANSASTRPSTMEPGDPSDFAAQEAAARDYQPQLEGPLVGNKITSDAITDEYAKADDVYVAKTINLPQTYSHYRPIQGDGNCGWRAIGFSYFEHLVNNGDSNQIFGEAARLTSFNQYLLDVGRYDSMLFEDMVEETIGLLKDLAQNVSNQQLAMHILIQRFNDQDASNAIIYHLRLLASSWLKGNADVYEPFIPGDTGIAGHCGEIERPNREIDHLGIMLLVQVLLKPINFVLEIAYLDRSAGSQVNIYRFPDEANGQDPASLGPIIYLLYRPDHYDILYKSHNPAPLNLQVNRVASFSHRQEIASVTPSLQNFANIDYTPLAMLPGFGGPPSGLSSGLSSLGSPATTSPLPDAYDPPPQSPWLAPSYSDHLQQQQRQQQQPVPTPRPQPQASPQVQAQPQQSAPPPGKPSQPVDYQLRFSHQCWHLSNTNSSQPSMLSHQSGLSEPSFTTAMFKNSHFNKAHYQNPHFHPEEWTPDDEGHERVPSIKKKGRLKSEH